MRKRYERILKSDRERSDFWPSFTDLLTTILLVVLLVSLINISQGFLDLNERQKEIGSLAQEVEEQAQALEDQAQELENQEKELAGMRETIQGQKALLEDKEVIIQEFAVVKQEIVDDLVDKFEQEAIDVSINEETGDIYFDSSILFDYGSSELKEEAKAELQAFVPTYMEVLAQYTEDIEEVIVEGHTDNDGSYLYNLKLSQDRAFSVMYYILSEEFGDFFHKDYFEQLATANGRSYSELIYTTEGNESTIDAEASRRVVFKFRLKGADYIAEQLEAVTE